MVRDSFFFLFIIISILASRSEYHRSKEPLNEHLSIAKPSDEYQSTDYSSSSSQPLQFIMQLHAITRCLVLLEVKTKPDRPLPGLQSTRPMIGWRSSLLIPLVEGVGKTFKSNYGSRHLSISKFHRSIALSQSKCHVHQR